MISNIMLPVSVFCGCYTLTSHGFAFFATPIFARFFIAFFKLQTLEKTVILNFFLQNPHGFFKVIVKYLDFDCLQLLRPLLSNCDVSDGYLSVIENNL